MLLEYDCDLEATNSVKNTVLNMAIAINTDVSFTITKLLVKRGANLEHRGTLNYTPLGLALHNQNLDVIDLLLQKKAMINVVDGFSGGPMHMAAGSRNLDLLKRLVSKGGDVNLADPNIYGTPLQAVLFPYAARAIGSWGRLRQPEMLSSDI